MREADVSEAIVRKADVGEAFVREADCREADAEEADAEEAGVSEGDVREHDVGETEASQVFVAQVDEGQAEAVDTGQKIETGPGLEETLKPGVAAGFGGWSGLDSGAGLEGGPMVGPRVGDGKASDQGEIEVASSDAMPGSVQVSVSDAKVDCWHPQAVLQKSVPVLDVAVQGEPELATVLLQQGQAADHAKAESLAQTSAEQCYEGHQSFFLAAVSTVTESIPH